MQKFYLTFTLLLAFHSFTSAFSQDNPNLNPNSNSNNSNLKVNRDELGDYLIMMDDPYEEDVDVYDEIFDQKITKKMKEKNFSPVKSRDETRFENGLEFRRYEDQQNHYKEQGDFAQWVSKKMIQHHIEKAMEEAPKDSALGMANSARVLVQNYKVEITPGNEFTAGYDLPTNKAKVGYRGWFGEHMVHANFNEEDFGPQSLQEFYFFESIKIYGTKFSSRYSFLDYVETLKIEQDFFYDGLVLLYQNQQNIKVSSTSAEHFFGLAFTKQF